MLVGLGVVAVASVLGATAGSARIVVFAVVLVVCGLALANARPVVWIALAITVTWTSRLLTTAGLAPRFLDFLDFPLVVAAVCSAGFAYLSGTDRLPADSGRIGRRLLLVAFVMTVSWAFNDWAEPQRLPAGLVLTLQPFLLLVAVVVAPLSRREQRLLVALAVAVLTVQLPFSLLAIAGGASGDAVKGTLLGTGAGHHVSAAGLALAFFLLLGLRVRRSILIPFGAAALFVMSVGDAKQVLFALPLALLVLGFTQRRVVSGRSALAGGVAGVVMAGGALFALLTYQSSEYAFDFIDRSVTDRTGKVAVVSVLWEDLLESPQTLVFGLGPGESVSRFSFLTTPELTKAGSPVALLGLHPSRGAERYAAVAAEGPYVGGNTSFASAQSSAMGIVGDYGLAGAAAFLAMLAAVIGALRRCADRGLRAAALASWTLLAPLAVVFDWLEQPPFTLAVLLVTGLALRPARPDPDTLPAVHAPPVPTEGTR